MNAPLIDTEQQIEQLSNASRLPQPTEPAIESATYKATPADFMVIEKMDIDWKGEGEHLWLEIEKTGMNTSYLASQLAKWAKIAQRDVGYSGIKDRHALTTQWFSLRIPNKQLPKTAFKINDETTQEYAKVLQQHWHHKKLNRGTHKNNYFILTLRHIKANQQAVEQQLGTMRKYGVPNYFGVQRFGHHGNNLRMALEWFEHGTINGRKPHFKKSRDRQSLILSSARSAIFNQILAQRVIDGTWHTGLAGEVFNLAGTGSVFVSDSASSDKVDCDINQRLASMDIHPTGAMWGIESEKIKPFSQGYELEKKVVQSSTVLQIFANALEKQKLKATRRPLRLAINDLRWNWESLDVDSGENNTMIEKSVLRIEFCLPSGSYATSVLSALVQNLTLGLSFES